jgi:hypothetical protein
MRPALAAANAASAVLVSTPEAERSGILRPVSISSKDTKRRVVGQFEIPPRSPIAAFGYT